MGLHWKAIATHHTGLPQWPGLWLEPCGGQWLELGGGQLLCHRVGLRVPGAPWPEGEEKLGTGVAGQDMVGVEGHILGGKCWVWDEGGTVQKLGAKKSTMQG